MLYKHNLKKLKHNPITTISYFIVRKLVSPFIRIIWVKKVVGIENIPKFGPAIIAFNHQSYFDFLCFIAISPRNIHFLSAEKFFESKFWLPLMKLTGQIKVDRENRNKHETHHDVYSHLNADKIIGIFPEGTRSTDKKYLLKPYTGVAKYALKSNVPIIPVGIRGTHEIMSKYDRKPKFNKIVEFRIGKPITFYISDLESTKPQLPEELTHHVMKEIAILSGKEYLHSNT